MHAPAPELAALRKLAEKYNAQYEKLLAKELEEIGAKPVVDKDGELFELEDRALTKDGYRVTIGRIDVKSKRVVVIHADGSKQLLMAHLLKKLSKNSKAGKPGSAPAKAKKAAAEAVAADPAATAEDVQEANNDAEIAAGWEADAEAAEAEIPDTEQAEQAEELQSV